MRGRLSKKRKQQQFEMNLLHASQSTVGRNASSAGNPQNAGFPSHTESGPNNSSGLAQHAQGQPGIDQSGNETTSAEIWEEFEDEEPLPAPENLNLAGPRENIDWDYLERIGLGGTQTTRRKPLGLLENCEVLRTRLSFTRAQWEAIRRLINSTYEAAPEWPSWKRLDALNDTKANSNLYERLDACIKGCHVWDINEPVDVSDKCPKCDRPRRDSQNQAFRVTAVWNAALLTKRLLLRPGMATKLVDYKNSFNASV